MIPLKYRLAHNAFLFLQFRDHLFFNPPPPPQRRVQILSVSRMKCVRTRRTALTAGQVSNEHALLNVNTIIVLINGFVQRGLITLIARATYMPFDDPNPD